jgi:hypothetical protein
MLIQHIALVPTSDGVDPSELARVSAALQKQVARDLGPLWGVSATVDAFPQLEDVPLGYWPILVSTGEESHDTGRFCDENGQPYAHLLLSPHWSVVASRTCLELLVNPSGTRSVVCTSPRYDQGLVQVLVDICAACEDPSHAYVINDVLVSDFCTPGFYESDAVGAQERCSFYGSIAAPLQVLIGGHLTWFDSASDSWWLRTQHEGEPVDTRLGSLDAEIGSVRELVRRHAPASRRTLTLSYEAFETRARMLREQAAFAAQARARRLRVLLGRHDAFDDVTREFELAEAPHILTRSHGTERSVVASFVLPPPDEPAAHTVPPALQPARPEQAHPAAREASAAAPRAASPTKQPPPSSSIAPPTLASMAPERAREGLDVRLVGGALVLAVLAVFAVTQRRASSTPRAARPAAAPAAVVDAALAPAPLAAAAPEPTPASSAAAASAVAPPVVPAATQPPRRRKADRRANETPIEALFETRR